MRSGSTRKPDRTRIKAAQSTAVNCNAVERWVVIIVMAKEIDQKEVIIRSTACVNRLFG